MAVTLPRTKNVSSQKEKVRPGIEALLNQHWDRLCRVVYKILGDWDEAQDIALETFLQLHQNPPRLETNITGWLYRVGTNRGLNALRSRQRRLNYEQRSAFTDNEHTVETDPEDILELNQKRQQVREALRSIKPRSAQLLVLRYSGLSYAELADVLKVSKNSIGTLLSRAEQEFASAFKENEINGEEEH